MKLLEVSRRIALAIVCVCLLGSAPVAHATQASLLFEGNVQTVDTVSLTLTTPSALVVDSAGNIYIADTGNNQIVEVTSTGSASVFSISGLSPSSLNAPSGIAIDAAGNLYIADKGNNRVVMVTPAGNGSTVSTGSVTLNLPQGVALDRSGNLFIADTGNNQIVEVTSGGSAAALTITATSGAASLSSPKGLAFNTTGNLYIADSGNNRVVTVAAGSTTGVVLSTGSLTPALSAPSSVAVDRIGNVFVADTGNNRIAEVDTASNGYQLLNTSYLQGTTLHAPMGVALDVFGTVYIADTTANRALAVTPYLNGNPNAAAAYTSSLNKSAVGFGHLALGTLTPTSRTLHFTTGYSSGLGGVKVLTAGVQNLDFQIVSGSNTTCSDETEDSSNCTVEVSYLPTAPGLRNGALVLYDPSLQPFLTLPLYGFSDAPVAALNPNTGAVISTGALATSNPYQVAIDGAGNLYVGAYSSKSVTKILAGGGSASTVPLGTPGTSPTAVQNITGVALDGAGNLFIGDHQNSRILVVTPGGVVSVLSFTGLSPALGFPTALAFDGAGNLYIADFTTGRIIEVSNLIVAGSTSTGKATVLNTGSYSFAGGMLTGLAVDLQGTVYAAARTQNNNKIVKLTAAGVASLLTIPSNITPAISYPQGVGVDAMGNVYIVDTNNNRIVQITTAGVATALSVTGMPLPATTLGSTIFGVTVSPTGNLYISDWTNHRIVFADVSGASLKFPTATKQGVPDTTDGTKTATVTNLGNRELTFSTNPTYTADFTNDPADTNPCTASTSLTPGTACNVAVKFIPQSVGSISAGITITNDTLNAAGSTQQVSASGTGTNPGDVTSTTVTVSPSALVRGQGATITATVADTTSGHTATIPTGSVSFTDTVGGTITALNSGSPVSLSGGSASLTGVVLNGTGTHTITANYAGVSGTFMASNNTTTAALSKASVTVSGPATQPVTVANGQTGSATVTVAPPYTTISMPSGTVSYSLLDANNASVVTDTITLTAGSGNSTASIPIPNSLAEGFYSISAVFNGDSNYLASSPATTIQVQIGHLSPIISWTPASSSIVYGTTLNGILNATAQYNSTEVPGSFTYTATPAGGSEAAVTNASALGAGSYTLTATFTPTDTATYKTVSSTTALTVSKAAQTITFTAPATPVTYGTAAVALGASGGGSGNAVTFTASGACSAVGSTLTYTASGSCSVTANQAGTANYEAAQAVSKLVSVQAAPLTATASSTSVNYGDAVPTITASYTGWVNNESASVLTATPSCTTTYTLTSVPGLYPTSCAGAVASNYGIVYVDGTLTVGKATQVITFIAPPSPVVYGVSPIALSATGGSSGNPVTFSVLSGPGVVHGNILTLSGTGTVVIAADQLGSTGSMAAAQVTRSIVVNQATSSLTLVSSANPVLVTSPITFTATATSAAGIPAGSASFYDGTTLLGTTTLSNGVASYTTSSLAAATHSITAVYAGNANLAGSTSSAIAELVQDFALNTSGSGGSGGSGGSTPSQVVLPGGTATYSLTLGPSNGTVFPAPVTLSVSGLPPGATATLSPQILPAGSLLSNVTLTIQLPSSTASLEQKPIFNRSLPPVFLGMLLLPFVGRLRRVVKKLRHHTALLLLLALSTVAAIGLSGCGSTNGFFGQAQKSYTVTITATSGTLSHSTNVTLTVQ